MGYVTLADLGIGLGYLDDIPVSDLAPLRGYMAQWQVSISRGDGYAASQIMFVASQLAERLAMRQDAARGTANVLGAIAEELGNVVAPAFRNKGVIAATMEPEATSYRRVNGNINLLVTTDSSGDIRAGAEAYATGANVTPEASAQTAAGIANRQQGLMQQIGQFQAGGRWNPAEAILALSAERVQPLQDEWASISSTIRNASLTDSDRQSLTTTQDQILYALGKKSAASSSAGSGISKVLENACANLRAIGLPCEGESGRDVKTKPTWPYSCANADDLMACLQGGPLVRVGIGAGIGGAAGGLAGVLMTESGIGSVVGLFSGAILGGLIGYYTAPKAES